MYFCDFFCIFAKDFAKLLYLGIKKEFFLFVLHSIFRNFASIKAIAASGKPTTKAKMFKSFGGRRKTFARPPQDIAPPVANCCGGRGKFLWRACECLAAAAKRLSLLAFGVGRMDDATAFSKCKDTKKKAKMQEKSLFILHFARFFVP